MFVQGGEGQAEVNGLQISSAFSLNPDCSPGCPTASFNPGRGSGPVGQLAQNGDMGSHNRAGDGSRCKKIRWCQNNVHKQHLNSCFFFFFTSCELIILRTCLMSVKTTITVETNPAWV